MDHSLPPLPVDKMRRKIILLCDGTACTAYNDKHQATNVVRLARCITQIDTRDGIPVPQVVHYMPGIGSSEELSTSFLNWYNQGIGKGVEEKIIEGYSFICHNYLTPHDKIILVGFSRGGFIVRCIADLIYRVGILTKMGLDYMRWIYKTWREIGEGRSKDYRTMEEAFGNPWPYDIRSLYNEPVAGNDLGDDDDDNGDDFGDIEIGDYDERLDRATSIGCEVISDHLDPGASGNFFRLSPGHIATGPASTNSGQSKTTSHARLDIHELLERICMCDPTYVYRGVTIEVCAAWDTVASLGFFTRKLGLFRPYHAKKLGFIGSDLGGEIVNAFQALSLHDRRRSFLPIVWRFGHAAPAAGRRLEQCWFMGYHGDVGGGRQEESLAQIPLAWMLGKLSTYLNMSSQTFWNPRPCTIKWTKQEKLERSATPVKERLRVEAKSTFTPKWWLGGSSARRPRRQFWTEGRFDVLPDTKIEGSQEFMHFTVRLLAGWDAIRRCPSLRGVEVPKPNGVGKVVWELRSVLLSRIKMQIYRIRKKAVPRPDRCYTVEEIPVAGLEGCDLDELDVELRLLDQWCEAEMEDIDLPDYKSRRRVPKGGTAAYREAIHAFRSEVETLQGQVAEALEARRAAGF